MVAGGVLVLLLAAAFGILRVVRVFRDLARMG